MLPSARALTSLRKLPQRQNDGLALVGLGRRVIGRHLDQRGDGLDVFLNLFGQLLRLASALLGGLRERPHLVGDHRKAASVIAGPRGLDGGIQRQEIGLVGNVADGFRHVADAGGLLAQLLDIGDRARLALRIVLDVARPRPDLVHGVRQKPLERVGALPRGLRAAARLDEARRRIGGDRQGFLRRAGGLFGAAGDLLHRSSQFLRGRRGFGNAAGHFLGGSRDTLLDFLLTGRVGPGDGRLSMSSVGCDTAGSGRAPACRPVLPRDARSFVFMSDFAGARLVMRRARSLTADDTLGFTAGP